MKNTVFLVAGAVITLLGVVDFFASSIPAGAFWTVAGLLILGYAWKQRASAS